MEFLDPKRQKAHKIRLYIGYVLIGLIILLTTTILLYWARGYGFKNGEVIQSGRVFLSSRPTGADIYINDQRWRNRTNTSLLMEAGQYTFELRRDGYRSWRRAINVEGGSVMRFDYPVLFPTRLTSDTVKQYDAAAGLYLHSPDRRWLLVQHGDSLTFDMFDFDNREDPPKEVVIPAGLISGTEGQRWELAEWSNDNRRMLLRHVYQKDGQAQTEYIVFDREEPGKSVSLNRVLGVNNLTVQLRDKKYDQYYLYDSAGQRLLTASLKNPEPQLLLERVLAFKTHGENRVLYATPDAANEGKAIVRLRDGDVTYTIRQVAQDDTYLLDLAEYDRDWFVAVGVAREGRTYLYKNPVEALKQDANRTLVPVHIFKLENPTYIAFSDTARFIALQSGTSFGVFDAENEKAYAFQTKTPLDDPQQHATWMDGHRLKMVSASKALVFDFDNANQEVLVETDPRAGMFFDRQYRFLYTVVQQTSKDDAGADITRHVLQRTSLLTPQDQ